MKGPTVYRPQLQPSVLQRKATGQLSVGPYRPQPPPRIARPGLSIQLAEAPPPAPPPPAPAAPPPGYAARVTSLRTAETKRKFVEAYLKGFSRYQDLARPLAPLAQAQRIFERSYITESDPATGNMQTYFLSPIDLEGGDRLCTPQDTFGYKSSMDVRTGRATAIQHGRSQREGEIAGSEIIFGQYRQMASVSGVPPAPLRTLERHHVQSASGEPVIKHIHGSSDKEGQRREFAPGEAEFYALLGTENLSSAVFLVRQRGAELGISGIDRITLEGSNVIVHFRPL